MLIPVIVPVPVPYQFQAPKDIHNDWTEIWKLPETSRDL